MVAILNSVDTEHFHHCGMFCWTAPTPDKALLFSAVDVFTSWGGQPGTPQASQLARPSVIMKGPTKAWMEGHDSLGSFAPVISHWGVKFPSSPFPLSELKFSHLLGGWRELGEAPGVGGNMRSAMEVGCEPVRDKSD